MQFTVHAAKSQLSRLIEAALAGEEVVIARGARPVVRLTPIPQGNFRLGVLSPADLPGCPDFLDPLGDDDLAAWEGGA